jgi:hypothetical protein
MTGLPPWHTHQDAKRGENVRESTRHSSFRLGKQKETIRNYRQRFKQADALGIEAPKTDYAVTSLVAGCIK